jgi:hypothetical protein
MDQQASVLPDAVVPAKPGAVALVEVDVVHTVSGLEFEDLVRRLCFGFPPLPMTCTRACGWAGASIPTRRRRCGELGQRDDAVGPCREPVQDKYWPWRR